MNLCTPAQVRDLDAASPCRRDAFALPTDDQGAALVYMCGNSLGLCPDAAIRSVQHELERWQRLAVDGHFDGWRGWYRYHEHARAPLSRLVGALPEEVVAMNGLTVNLHMLLQSFYRPRGTRTTLLMESPAFPSDTAALHSHVRSRGLDPDEHVLTVQGDAEGLFGEGHFEAAIEAAGDTLACVLLPGVSFLTGEALDIESITTAAHRAGATVGFDLAHAAGNMPLSLHEWDVDFAAWCSYKYLNSGPGAVAGTFVHQRHHASGLDDLPRLMGWWSTDPDTRFNMHLGDMAPVHSADAWQCSNPPILALAPLIASLELFDQSGMEALRIRSLQLTGFLREQLEQDDAPWRILTPQEPHRHGAQLSIELQMDAAEAQQRLQRAGVVCDARPPRVIRLAPVPLYNTFEDCRLAASVMRECLM